jgi:GNAT superfamily N-acetyltransferase
MGEDSEQHLGDRCSVRPATPVDLPAVAALCRAWAAEHLTRNYRADTIEELRTRLGECFLVADKVGKVVGFVIGQLRGTAGNEFVEGVLDDRPEYLEVQDLYVAATERRAGVGRRLMGALLQIAKRRGVSGSLVYSANRDYVATARFYEQFGYEMWHIHMTRGGRK